ncbi:MAG TPA: ribbon-helix-helix protein, CopG family [Jiangellales bacterium]|nr:ribbon-helix-helix protein, CopG family [Jiangellales bacterium]
MPAPKPTPKRSQVVVRLADAGLEQIDRYAEQEQRTRSDMIRVLLGEAIEVRRKRERRTR